MSEVLNKIDPVLTNFDQFPNSAHIRLPVVCALLGVSPATVWRMVKAGSIRTHKLTPRTTSFNVGEIRSLIS